MPADIQLASINDCDNIMRFLKDEWGTNHILAINKDFFLYEFGEKDSINFVISKDKNAKLNGVLGFYKSNSTPTPEIWTAMWKVRKNLKNPILGVLLFKYLLQNVNHRFVLASGANLGTLPIYERLGFQTGTMGHYYLVNPHVTEFRIADISSSVGKRIDMPENKLKSVENSNELKNLFNLSSLRDKVPFKDFEYIKKRYFEHPIHIYKVFGVKTHNQISTLIILREVRANNSKAVRIVDFIGVEEDLPKIRGDLLNFVVTNEFEYIDFFQHGISWDTLKKAGFVRLDSRNEKDIIPHYFSPFVQENIETYFFADSRAKDNFCIFKADGDQDRPNQEY